ncbi:MAG TPA: carboxymuconolactone decarboxylase family protein [Candidatus Binatia bacterium]|nr:carboxymuconolactone decarboxylase family protein [Candidatus Binatia bacterium]
MPPPSRLPKIDPATLSAEQRRIYDAIAAAHGGEVRGPWAIELRVPEVAEHMHALYDRLCVRPAIGKRLFELMVITVARHWTSQFEWFAHERQARAAGISDAVIDAIRERRTPAFERDDEQLVYDVVSELNRTQVLSDATYARARETLGEAHLVELIAGMGTYTSIAIQLNAFAVEPPPDARRLV